MKSKVFVASHARYTLVILNQTSFLVARYLTLVIHHPPHSSTLESLHS